jgi:hypothetical protein
MRALLLLLLLAAPAAAQPRPDGLLALESQANALCRGGSGDDPQTIQACEVRDDLVRRLLALDWCRGRQGEVGAEMSWHRCEARSLQRK